MRAARKKPAAASAKSAAHSSQLDLFSAQGSTFTESHAGVARSELAAPLAPPHDTAKPSAPATRSKARTTATLRIRAKHLAAPTKPLRHDEATLRIVRAAELPSYAASDIEAVDKILSAWPPTKALFTYAEISRSFGISRATSARRIKSGLIPGITFAGERVLADGPVRRLTREQVMYLLLSVRGPR